ncbi:MAG: hypothetical protein KAS71_04190, partial [Bacteroidales bacterium]|nr:hypothetical protein [Bacteroidales bacterium]
TDITALETLADGTIYLGDVGNVAQEITISGDITMTNAGVTTIANNAVTYGKMQAVSTTSKLLGSSDAANPVTEITLGTGLSMTGTTLNATINTFANPTATIGLTATNGVATTAMRSDAAPALSQAIIPTWTGAHTFSALGTFNAGITVTGGAINLNNDATANDVNIGTSTNTGTVTIGGTAAQTIDIGSGAAAKTVTLGSDNTTSTTTIEAGSGGLDLGASAVAKTITIGNTTGATAVNIKAGTGTSTFETTGAGTLVIGGAASTGALTLGSSSNTQTVNIGTGAAAATVNIATGDAAGDVIIGDNTGSASSSVQINGATTINGAFNLCIDNSVGGNDTYTATNTTITTLVPGLVILFSPLTNNNFACTLNLNGTGALAITIQDGSDPANNDLQANGYQFLVYTGTTWMLISTF